MVLKYMDKFRIKSTRLKWYDYSQDGAYFVTICTKNKTHLFGEIENDNQNRGDNVETGLRPVSTVSSPKIKLSNFGKIVADCWHDLPNHYSNIILDEFVVMPDHIHGIIIIRNGSDNKIKHGMSEFIRAFKSFSSRRINEFNAANVVIETGLRPVSMTKSGIWQPRFYDRIIRSDNELNRIRLYIKNNPTKFHGNM
jgi:REP element-mobilizing transposase RayT